MSVDLSLAVNRANRAEKREEELLRVLLEIAEAEKSTRSYRGEGCDCPQPAKKKKGSWSCNGHETNVQRILREAGITP